MTTVDGIIISTLILFVIVASQDTVLQGEEGAVCNVNVSKTETYLVWNCEECERHQRDWFTWKCRGEDCARRNRKFTILREEQKCCDGYENRNSVCKPQCSPKCEDDHFCAKPNKCECIKPGWVGRNCTESLWCVVKVNGTEILSNNPVKVRHDDTLTQWERPGCLPQCLDQIPNPYGNVLKSKDMNIYFVPIESPCNIKVGRTFEDIFQEYKYPLAGTLGIILCAIVIFYVTCFLKRERKATCDGEDIPMRTGATQDYTVENMIYS